MSGVVSTPFSNVELAWLGESSAPLPLLGEKVCEELPPFVSLLSELQAPRRNASALEAQMIGINDFFMWLFPFVCLAHGPRRPGHPKRRPSLCPTRPCAAEQHARESRSRS